MPRGKRLTPLRSGNIRYLSMIRGAGIPPTTNGGIQWASCQQVESSPFRRSRSVPTFGAINVTGGDVALLGLAGLALAGPLSLAYVGPSFLVTATSIIPGGGVTGTLAASGLAASSLSTLLGGLIKPQGPQFVSFKKPCSEQAGGAF